MMKKVLKQKENWKNLGVIFAVVATITASFWLLITGITKKGYPVPVLLSYDGSFWVAFDKATKNGALYTEDAVAEQDSEDAEEAVAKKDVKEAAEEAEKVASEIIQKNAKPDTASTKTAAPATTIIPKESEEPNNNGGTSNDDGTKGDHGGQTERGSGNFDISHPDVTFDEYGVGRSNIDPSQRYYAYPSGNVYEITDPNFNMDTIGQSSDWQTTGKFAGRTTQQ